MQRERIAKRTTPHFGGTNPTMASQPPPSVLAREDALTLGSSNGGCCCPTQKDDGLVVPQTAFMVVVWCLSQRFMDDDDLEWSESNKRGEGRTILSGKRIRTCVQRGAQYIRAKKMRIE